MSLVLDKDLYEKAEINLEHSGYLYFRAVRILNAGFYSL